MARVLVTYYSATGSVHRLAEAEKRVAELPLSLTPAIA